MMVFRVLVMNMSAGITAPHHEETADFSTLDELVEKLRHSGYSWELECVKHPDREAELIVY
jgi:hypothetical protein